MVARHGSERWPGMLRNPQSLQAALVESRVANGESIASLVVLIEITAIYRALLICTVHSSWRTIEQCFTKHTRARWNLPINFQRALPKGADFAEAAPDGGDTPPSAYHDHT